MLAPFRVGIMSIAESSVDHFKAVDCLQLCRSAHQPDGTSAVREEAAILIAEDNDGRAKLIGCNLHRPGVKRRIMHCRLCPAAVIQP